MHFFRSVRIVLLIIFVASIVSVCSLVAQTKSYKRDYFVPEPLYFDLIRNLGARKGEIEGNMLTKIGKDHSPVYSPEIEYAFLDDHAVELEIAFEESHISEGKLAYQWTMGTHGIYQHGIQTIAQYSTRGLGQTYTALYLSGFKLNDTISFLMMNGFQTFSGKSYLSSGALDQSDESLLDSKISKSIMSNRYLWNGNFFYDMSETWIFGLEINFRTNFKNEKEIIILPNSKYHFSKHSSFHLGLGMNRELDANAYFPILVMRAILEF
ncbi:MAG: hypothetical protein CK427_04430 [Leptospira sp.]|nr:MAG: hypothetical protein CK427_04430 [Leptospira sp.]